MELEKEIVFYKPNQLIMMDRSGLNRFQEDVMNIMLKKAQDMIAYNGRVFRGEILSSKPALTEAEVLDYVHKISIKEMLEATNYKIDVKQTTRIKELLNQLQQMAVKTYDKHRFNSLIIFQRLSYNGFTNDLEYVLGNSWTKCFYYDTCLINEDGTVNENNKKFFTPIGQKFRKKFNSTHISGLLDYILRYSLFSQKVNFVQKIKLNEFKALIGIRTNSKGEFMYASVSDFKKRVLIPIVNELKDNGVLIELNITGRGAEFKEVEIKILKGTVIPDFLIKGYEAEFKEMEKGNKFLIQVLQERGKGEDDIKRVIEGTKYSFYLRVMDRLKLIPVDEDEFDKGYRYIVK